MSYADPVSKAYSFPAIAFGTGSSQTIRGPKGKTGIVRDIHVSATVLFTAVTTSGRVDVGNSTTAAAAGSLTLGTLAAGGSRSVLDGQDATSALVSGYICPADTDVKVSFVAPTGGSPAGTGTVTVFIDWDV